ncbi:MAG: thymidylate synthase [Armatimonadota bacterium]
MQINDSCKTGTMEFKPIYFADKIKIINPFGRLGVVTLWSKLDYVENVFNELKIPLDENSPIAVMGNLYGNGLPHLLRNLLYNPQIRDIVLCGSDLSGSAIELINFFRLGIDTENSLGKSITKIKGTQRILDSLVTPDMFEEKPRFVQVGDLRNSESKEALVNFIRMFQPIPCASNKRIKIDIPQPEILHKPSEPRAHTIVKDTPLKAWQELIFRLINFGRLVHLRKGDRQELQNVKVVIRCPCEDDAKELEKYNFTLDSLRKYQEDMLNPQTPIDQPYTYGNRIGKYYGFDALEKFAEKLNKNPQDRDCYLALWDSHLDIDAEDAPCLVSLFFRVFEDELTLTATYRTHNALDAWLKNIYGLMYAQKTVAEKTGFEVGALTVISHSISIDPARYDFAKLIADSKGFSVDLDPNGYFNISIDGKDVIVKHFSPEGVLIKEYKSDKIERLQHEINRDGIISEIGHAIYIGRQLQKAEYCIKNGEEFIQE